MTVDQIRAAKREAEGEILQILARLEQNTQLRPLNLEINMLRRVTGETEIFGVRIELETI